MTCPTTLAEVVNALNAHDAHGGRHAVKMDITDARRVIEESNGLLTWLDAGETWARVCFADNPDAWYPAL